MGRTCPNNGPGNIANENLERIKKVIFIWQNNCTDRDGNDLTM